MCIRWTRRRAAPLGSVALVLVGTWAALAADRLGPEEGVAPRVLRSPTIDGDITDRAWQAAPKIDNFVDAKTRGAPFRATWMKALHDERHLYLAVWCQEPNPARIKAKGKPESRVWEDDCLEVFVRHTNEPGEYIQLITNTKDVHEDYMNVLTNSPGKAWNSTWVTATKVGQDAWTTEMRIPLKELGISGEPLRGDFISLRVGREIWSDHVQGDPNHPARLCMWPWASGYSGSFGYGRIFLGSRNLLRNLDLSGDHDRAGFPRPWGGTRGAIRLFSASTQPGETVVRIDAAKGMYAQMQQGLRVRPGDTYRVRAEVRGDVPIHLQVRVPVPGQKATAPIACKAGPWETWQPVELDFSSPGPQALFSFRAGARAPGKSVYVRRLEVVKQAAGVRPHYLSWKIKDPLPRHGLEALAARRFGVKPYELLEQKGVAGQERTVLHDSSTGTEMWLLTRDRANECHIYHNLVWCFSASGKWIEFAADRPEAKPPKHRRWAARTDGGAVVPLVGSGCSYHWSTSDGDLHYHDIRGDPGSLVEFNVATGVRRVLASLGKWTRPWGIVARPGKGSDRLVVVYPDNRTGFTVKLDGTGRKEVVFEPPGRGLVKELYFSKGHPNILYGRGPHVYRLEPDGSISHVCASQDRAKHGYRNMFRSGHGDTSRSEVYSVRPNGTVTHPDGRIEKVYDPSVHAKLGGFFGCNGSITWGPTDDWFLIEQGLHFVKVWRDGRAFQFLGFHLAVSLDYYSMAWGQMSPDGTKVVTKTTMFDNTDMMLVLASRPMPPANVRLDGNALAWDRPKHSAEIKGYFVYAAAKSGGPYRQLVSAPINGAAWPLPADAPKPGYYVVTSVEHCGQEGPFSREVEVGVGGDAPVRLFVEAELLDMKSPVVERREARASNWHYVAQDPYVRLKLKRDGELVWRCPAPVRLKAKPLTLWARVRSTGKARVGSARALARGKELGKLVTAGEDWTWTRAKGRHADVVPKDGVAEVVLVPQDGAFAVDMLALFSNPDDKPSGRGNADPTPPSAPAGLKAETAGDREAFLTWRPSRAADLLHYNVYASIGGTVRPEQRYRVGSPHQPKFLDWGLKTGASCRYLATAVDRAGNESAPSAPAAAATPRRAEAVMLLEAESARRSETGKGPAGAFLGEDAGCSGGRFVGCGVPGEKHAKLPARLKLPHKHTALSWKVNVTKPGEYMVWLRLRSARRIARLEFSLDGKPLETQGVTFGWWDARTQNLIWGDLNKAYCWFWTDVPLRGKLDTRPLRVKLARGRHTFQVSNIWAGLDVDAVVLTSDFTWVPKGTVNYF